VALARHGDVTLAYAADQDAKAIHTIDVTTGMLVATTPVGGAPAQVLVLEDGRVAVALRDQNRVQILEPSADFHKGLTGRCAVKTPVEPVGLAASPDDDTLLVTTAWARKLSAYDAGSMKHRFDADLPREPRDVVVDDDGSRAFVAHVVGGTISVVDLEDDDHEARDIDLHVRRVAGATTSGKDRRSCQGFALAKTSDIKLAAHEMPNLPKGRIFAPRVTIDPGEPSQRTSGYGANGFAKVESPIVSVVDTAAERNLTRGLMPTGASHQLTKGECLLPRSARVSHTTGGLLVACAGTDALVEMDPRGTDPARLERRRWKVPSGPLGLAVDDEKGTAVVWSQFDRQLAIVNLKSKTTASAVDIVSAPRLAKGGLSADAAWGRKLFHTTDDPRISRDGRACASCHPDGREDSLTWSTPVGPRQTIMLAGRVKASAPHYSWLGVHENVKVHLRRTFQRLGGAGLPEREGVTDELDALVAYIESMPGPNLKGALPSSEPRLVATGKKLFFAEDTGCASCHTGGAGTDKERHDLGTMARGDNDPKFDTPSLRFIGGTAPYFHDGRYDTLMALLTASDSQMGHTMHLSRKDAKALAAYLETL
jgi:DNA-binding beta-propeller fold protein YncE